MKKHGKLFAIITMIALLLTSLMPVSVFAANPADGKITITPPNGSTHTIVGQTFSIYRIFDLTYNETNNAYSYTLAPDFRSLNYLNKTEAELVTFLEGASENSSNLDDFAEAVLGYINSNNIQPSASKTADDSEKVEFANLPYGYYLVTGAINANGGGQEVIASCSLTTVTANVNIIPKADAPTIDKQVDHHGTWQEWTDLDIGDTAQFKITSAVPNMKGYETYQFIVHDTMSAGLDLIDTSFIITVDGEEIVRGTDYTVNVIEEIDEPTIITITFNQFIAYKTQIGAPIVIEYSAYVNENALISVPEEVKNNTNKVYLEYSNNPNIGGEGETEKTPEDTVCVYAFEIDIYKYTGDLASSPTALADAWFILKDNKGSNISLFKDDAGNYRVPAKTDTPNIRYTVDLTSNTGDYIVSDSNGNIKIYGLDAGTYVLEEVKAPNGYNKLDYTINVTITNIVTEDATGDPNTVEITVTNIASNADTGTSPAIGTINILNNSGTIFPGTGGIGRTIFILVGSTMLAVGLISLVVFRKKIFGTK